MGSFPSKPQSTKHEAVDTKREFMDRVKDTVNDEIARRMMQQREMQLAINIAKARDTIWYFGSAWSVLVSGVTVAHMAGRKPPPVVGVPIVIGALVLGNLADMAYGTKMMRVVKEAEHILEHERGRLVPFKQAPFHKFSSTQEKAVYYDVVNPVGSVFPTPFLFGSFRASAINGADPSDEDL